MSMTTENQNAVPLVDELAIEASLVESGITSKRLPTVLRMAETALRAQGELMAIANDAYSAWDNDQDSKVGKLLRAMVDEEFRRSYRPHPQGEEHGPNN